MPAKPIRRALISVYDKMGLVPFARALHDEFGVEIISTGGTAKTLTDAGVPVTLVEDITGSPEMLDGRVKTLHPKIHAAILADRDNPEHMHQLAEQGIEPIDMVVVNLYPFEETIARPGCTFEQAIEMIDIGGPCLLRAAAKNHKHVLVVCHADSAFYDIVLDELRSGYAATTPARRDYAAAAFDATCRYDVSVSEWLDAAAAKDGRSMWRTLRMFSWGPTRYGENPHQAGELFTLNKGTPFDLTTVDVVVEGNQLLSFNNYVDTNAALELCAELSRATDRGMWHRFSTGDLATGEPSQREKKPTGYELTGYKPVPHKPVPHTPVPHTPVPRHADARDKSVAPVSNRWNQPISDEHFTRRNLPHIQQPEATYFITFRLRQGELASDERTIVLDACKHWHGEKMTLHAAVVMPDHVHLLLTPHAIAPGQFVSPGEIMQSVKRYSAREVNKRRGMAGSLWRDESFDRIVRDEREFVEKWEYIEANPVTARIVDRPREYDWFWASETSFGERVGNDRFETGVTRLETDEADHRLKTGATELGESEQNHQSETHRLETGATVCCFVKHTNACGVAVDAEPVEAYRRAYLGDPNAAMGGILAVNFAVDRAFAETVMNTYQTWGKPLKEAGEAHAPGAFFVEVWLAPEFDNDAVERIRGAKAWGKRVRLLAVGDMSAPPDQDERDYKRIAGGMLTQDRDLVGLNEDEWRVVTKRGPTDAEVRDLRLAWLVCKHTKSNAITICRDGMLIGNGAGQMSRVMSCRIATWLARENGHAGLLAGAVAASDAFFPFRDGPDILMAAGVSALIQPGGSKRDAETIAACDERGAAMIFTGTRHFRH